MFLYFQHLRLNTSCIFSFISGAGGSWITWSKTVAALAQDLKKALAWQGAGANAGKKVIF